MWLRSSENEPVQNSGWDRKTYLSDWYDNPLNRSEVEMMYDDLADHIMHVAENQDRERVSALLRRVIDGRVERDRLSIATIRHHESQKAPCFMGRAKSRTKGALRYLAKISYPVIKYVLDERMPSFYCSHSRYSYARLLADDIEISDVAELNDVLAVVKGFHLNGVGLS